MTTDDRLRSLERAAEQGDERAVGALVHELERLAGATHSLSLRRQLRVLQVRSGVVPPNGFTRLESSWALPRDARELFISIYKPSGLGVVPHSELAMHAGAAGMPVVQYALYSFYDDDFEGSGRIAPGAIVSYLDPDGYEIVMRGGIGEVLPFEVSRKIGGRGQERIPVLTNPDERRRRRGRLARMGAMGPEEARLRRIREEFHTGQRFMDPLVARGAELTYADKPLRTLPSPGANVRLRRGSSSLVEEEARGSKRKVKNLGWLLSRLRENNATLFVRTLPDGNCYLRAVLWRFHSVDPTSLQESVAAHQFQWTGTFETIFDDCTVLWEWLHRPVLWGMPIDWDGRRGVVADVYGASGRKSTYAPEGLALPAPGWPWLPMHPDHAPHLPGHQEHVDYEHFSQHTEPHVRDWIEGGLYAPPVANPHSTP